MKNILLESTKSNFKVLEHKPANVLKRIQGVLSDFKTNRNGRIYPKELWENVLSSDYVKEMIESHGLVGELDHPEERLEISLQNVSHVINDMWIEGDKVMGTIDILPTPSGKIVSELLDYGTDIGISSRGAGSVGANNIVDPDYQFVTFDFVARPSCEAARLNMIVESVQPEIDNNSDDKVNNILENYKTGLKENSYEPYDKSYYEDRKILRERLYPIIRKYWSTIFSDEYLSEQDIHINLPGLYDKSIAYISFSTRKNPYYPITGYGSDDIRKLKQELKQEIHNLGLKGLRFKTKRVRVNWKEEPYTEIVYIIFDYKPKLNEESDFETYIDYSGERPVEKKRHTMSYCNMAALDMVHDALSDQLGVDWRKKSLSDIEDIVHETVFRYNEANVEPEYENEDFYGDEANANEIYKYILDNEISEENKTTETKPMNESVYIIKQYAEPFGVYNVCEWEADSPEKAVEEFLEINPSYRDGKYGAIRAELKNGETKLNEAVMSDQEVFKVVLGWYKQQIESGKMTLNQCYQLLSDKAKVSLNKMVDQSKIKESMINNTINKLINESIELNRKE